MGRGIAKWGVDLIAAVFCHVQISTTDIQFCTITDGPCCKVDPRFRSDCDPGIYFAARAVGDGAKLYVRGADLNITKNCSNQVYTPLGNSTTYVFAASRAEGIVVGYASALKAIYADMHDGDKKEITISGASMTIKPSGNNQTWMVKAALDTKSC